MARKDGGIERITRQLLAELTPRHGALADELGVTYSTLYSWSTGRRRPSPANARRLAEASAERAGRLAELADALRQVLDSDDED